MKLTMVNQERLKEFKTACEHVMDNNIPGAVVECGVWRGGATIYASQFHDRDIIMYDTFEGMTEPSEFDVYLKNAKDKRPAHQRWQEDPDWCRSPIEEVQKNLDEAGVDAVLVKGDICKTAITTQPESIAVLRCDVDFYEGTKAILIHLLPLVSPGGIVLFDDYDSWAGERKAANEFGFYKHYNEYIQ